MVSIPQKHCSKCKQLFPATNEYFYKNNQQPSGLSPRCKSCIAEDHGVENRRKVIKCEPGMRGCRQCGNIYPETLEYFTPNKECKGGINYLCRVCRRAYMSEVKKRPDQREKRKQWNRDYTKTPTGRKKNTDRCRKAAKTNPNIKVNRRVQRLKRVARKKGLPDTLTRQEWINCVKHFEHKCAVCERAFTDTLKCHADHWIPLTSPDCPGTVVTNMLPLCGGESGCNLFKHNADPLVWLNSRYSPSEVERILARINEYFALVRR